MSLSTDNAGSAFRSFSASDLGTLEALQSHPRPAGWTFHRDRDESWDLIAIQPPSYHRRDHDPLWRSPAFLVIPAPIGEVGVLLTLPNGTVERAYGSLVEALGDVGPPKVSWKRCLA